MLRTEEKSVRKIKMEYNAQALAVFPENLKWYWHHQLLKNHTKLKNKVGDRFLIDALSYFNASPCNSSSCNSSFSYTVAGTRAHQLLFCIRQAHALTAG
jgi:hypothetical protein